MNKCDRVELFKKGGALTEFGSLPHERLDVNIECGYFTIGRGKVVQFKDRLSDYNRIIMHWGESRCVITPEGSSDS